MFELLADPNTWIAFATLTVMEVVLGIDNIVFISVLVARLPKPQADRARRLGLALALAFRILLLLLLTWIIALDTDLFTAFGIGFSWKDIILIGGGLFLLYKGTTEMHHAIEEPHEPGLMAGAKTVLSAIIVQIVLIDLVFSIDSIVTAIGMAQHVEIMIAAVVVAVALMFIASGPIAGFVARHPTTKMLALAFLLMIGLSLVADGLGFHIDKGYIYAAMAFSVLVESINIVSKQRRRPPVSATGDAPLAAATPRPKPRTTAASRAKARPKSAPRKK